MKELQESIRGRFEKSRMMNEKDRSNICKFFGPEKIASVELLYRATDDGFEASQFHSKCDDKGATLSLIWNSKNKKFGGFTT